MRSCCGNSVGYSENCEHDSSECGNGNINHVENTKLHAIEIKIADNSCERIHENMHHNGRNNRIMLLCDMGEENSDNECQNELRNI